MEKSVNLFGATTILLSFLVCTPPPTQIEPFVWVKAFAGDSRATVQFWINQNTLLEYGGMFGHFKLMRSEEGKKFEQVAELGPLNPIRAGWALTDTSVQNGKTYRYFVHAVFAIFTNPEAEGFSDTMTVTPEEGLADPRPPAPESLNYKHPLVEDTVDLYWGSPDSCDGLYYLLYAPSSLEFTTYYENIDGVGQHAWDPGGSKGVRPVKLDSSFYRFLCARDGDTRYYMVYAFRDSILSYPSETLKIEHTWQP